MGLYIYITDQDRIDMRKINDPQIMEVFNEALQYDPTLMISETTIIVKDGWFKKKKTVSNFNIFHECFAPNGTPAHQARQQLSASGSKQIVIAYLYGIINRSLSQNNNLITPQTKMNTNLTTINVEYIQKEQYEEDLKRRQQEHLEKIHANQNKNLRPCLHDSCPSCLGTGIKQDGSLCIHMISCPCPKCSTYY